MSSHVLCLMRNKNKYVNDTHNTQRANDVETMGFSFVNVLGAYFAEIVN